MTVLSGSSCQYIESNSFKEVFLNKTATGSFEQDADVNCSRFSNADYVRE